MKTQLLRFLAGLCILNSCSKNPPDPIPENFEKVRIHKIDSFAVQNPTEVIIQDYDKSQNRFFGYSQVENDLLEISPTGSILKRIHKKGPDGYGNWNPIGIAFGPEQTRIVELPYQLITYDSSYQELHRLKIQNPLPIRTYGPLGRTASFQNQDSTFYLVGTSNYLSAHFLVMDKQGMDTLKLFYRIHSPTGDTQAILPYRNNSVYKKATGIYPDLMTKSYLIDHHNNKLYLLHGLAKEIEVYQLPDMRFSYSIPLKHSKFISYPSVPFGTPGNDPRITPLRFLAARNQKFIQVDTSLFLVQYYTGIQQSTYQDRIAKDATYIPTQDPGEQSLLILREGNQLSEELSAIPGEILFGLGEGKFLVKETRRKQEGVTRFSRYQIQY